MAVSGARTAVASAAPLSHRQAVCMLLAATLMWSSAGVISRLLHNTQGFEPTFWRSAFCVLSLVPILAVMRGPRALLQALLGGGRVLWLSGLCWAVMFTAFMVALTFTTVANVLVTMSIGPLFTALLARITLGQQLLPRTWAAIVLAGLGIAWMYGHGFSAAEPGHLVGTAVALAVPAAAAVNWTLLQRLKNEQSGSDMLPAVLIGALLSALLTLPLAWPLSASAHDISLLALLGVFQLAVPCLMAVVVARVLPGPEIALLGLLEVVLGVAWAWLGAGEKPDAAVLAGGSVVLVALAGNGLLALRR